MNILGNRKSRKQRYQESITGKIGGLDIVSKTGNEEYIINARGEKVHMDIERHKRLEITDSGSEHHVLSVGVLGYNDIVQVYRLPNEYRNWVEDLRNMSALGVKLLPANVLFAKSECIYTVDIL